MPTAIANTAIQLKKSGSSGNTPVNLSYGELALNYADGKLFYKNLLNNIDFIENQDTFGSVNANSILVIATTPTDVLSLVAGSGVIINANSTNKSITISSTGGSAGSYANAAFIQANAAYSLANTLSSGSVNVFSSNVLTVNNELLINTSILTSVSYISANTNQVIIDKFLTSAYRSAKYDVQMTNGSNYHVFEVRVLQDGNSAFMTQYGEIFTSTRLGTIDAECSGGYLNLLFQPDTSPTIIKLLRTAIAT